METSCTTCLHTVEYNTLQDEAIARTRVRAIAGLRTAPLRFAAGRPVGGGDREEEPITAYAI